MSLKIFRGFFKRKGQGVVEYALLLGVVAVIIVGITTDGGLTEIFHDTLEIVVDQFTKYNEAYDSSVVDNAWD